MKITLIEPKPPGKHVFNTVKMPRLGLPILGTILQQQGHEVNIVYGTHRNVRVSDLAGCHLIGISSTTSTAPLAYHLADFVRSQGIPVVMGGPHVSFQVEEALQHCDYVIRGEGDTTFPALVESLARGEAPLGVRGVSFYHNGELIHTPSGPWADVGGIPYPEISIFGGVKLSTYPVMTSRGCPYNCTFCSVTPMFGHKTRCRSIDAILQELEQYKGKQVFFVDDNFTANSARAKALMRAMIEHNVLPKRWSAQVRTEAARDDELLRLMRDSGCGYVYVGMESVNPKTLQSYNKHQQVSDIENCIKRFHDFGIMVHGMFVFGSDEDTAQTMEQTLKFACENKIDTVQFLILTPLPGTRTFADLKEKGRILTYDWSNYDAHHVVFNPLNMSPQELQAKTVKAFKQFYSFTNIFKNMSVSGWRSVAFRALGYWLVRQWEKENKWYYQALDDMCSSNTFSNPLNQQPHVIKVIKNRLLSIEFVSEGTAAVAKVTGKLGDTSMSKTIKSFLKALNSTYQNLLIDAGDLTFVSETALVRFMNALNRATVKAHQTIVRLPLSHKRLFELMAMYDIEIPTYIIREAVPEP